MRRRLAGKPNDQIGADRGVGPGAQDAFDAIAKIVALRNVVASATGFRRRRTATADADAGRTFALPEIISTIRSLNSSGSSELIRTRSSGHRSAIISSRSAKLDRRIEILAVAAEMHARKNDFLEAARMKIVERRHHAARLDAARSAARKRHDTESAELIASFLQFQKGARMTVERDRGQLDRRLLLAQIA